MQKVLAVVDYQKAGEFFLRLARYDMEREYTILTTLPSIKILAKKYGVDCRLVGKMSAKANHTSNITASDRVREIRSGVMTVKSSNTYKNILKHAIDKICTEKKIDYIVCWNGEDVIGFTIRLFSGKARLLFLEIANIPGKIFRNNTGVNASSSLFSNPLVLDNINVDKDNYLAWKTNYISNKMENIKLPQAKNAQLIGWHHYFNTLYNIIWGAKKENLNYLYNKYKYKKRVELFQNDNYKAVNLEDYILFPMQVSNDSQILLNSSFGGNVEAVEYLLSIHGEKNIVVKPHPAEQDINYMKKFFNRFHSEVMFTNENTFELVNNASEVFSINSTVGLEALIVNKKVTFLGETFFKHFNSQRLMAYIQGYLISIDFFDEGEVCQSEINRIFNG